MMEKLADYTFIDWVRVYFELALVTFGGTLVMTWYLFRLALEALGGVCLLWKKIFG